MKKILPSKIMRDKDGNILSPFSGDTCTEMRVYFVNGNCLSILIDDEDWTELVENRFHNSSKTKDFLSNMWCEALQSISINFDNVLYIEFDNTKEKK